jgi:hypothetical protein
MVGLLCFVLAVLASPFKSTLRLEAENAVLRHQLNVLRRRPHGRVRLTNNDRWFFMQLYRWFPSILRVLTIIRPETLVRWHRAGFRTCWRWKSRPLGGCPRSSPATKPAIKSPADSARRSWHGRSFHTVWTLNGHHRRGYRTDKDFKRYPLIIPASDPMAVQAIPSVDIGSQRQGTHRSRVSEPTIPDRGLSIPAPD